MREIVYFLSGVAMVLVGVGGAIWVLLKAVEELKNLVRKVERKELPLLSGIFLFIVCLGAFTLLLGAIGAFTFVGVGFIDVNLKLGLLSSLWLDLLGRTIAAPAFFGLLALFLMLGAYGNWTNRGQEGGEPSCATQVVGMGIGVLWLYFGMVTMVYWSGEDDPQWAWSIGLIVAPIIAGFLWMGRRK